MDRVLEPAVRQLHWFSRSKGRRGQAPKAIQIETNHAVALLCRERRPKGLVLLSVTAGYVPEEARGGFRHMALKLRPLADRLVVEPIERDEITSQLASTVPETGQGKAPSRARLSRPVR